MPKHVKTFDTWMDEVENKMDVLSDGMFSIWDLPDEDYYNMYEDGYTAAFAAKKIFYNNVHAYN